MIAQAKAELFKIRSTRTTLWLVLGMLALVLLLVALTGLLSRSGALTGKDAQAHLLGLGGVAVLFAALAGLMVVTAEYRHGTIRPTLLFTPCRPRVICAKLASSMITGLAFGVAAEALGFAVGTAILAGRGVPFALNRGEVIQLVVGTIVGVVLWGGLGVGLGAIMRNQVAAVIGLLAWILVIENLVFGLAPSVGRYGPAQAASALSGLTTENVLSPVAAGVVLMGWTAVLIAAGVVLVVRRDVD
jgi:ABC-2 type transport system permease protein